MREINKTIYQVLKMEEPDDGINVTQLITDDVIKQSETGGAKAVQGATQLLDRKADELYKTEEKKTRPKVVKASGTKTAPPPATPSAPAVPAPPSTPVKKAPVPLGTPAKKAATPPSTPVKKAPVPLNTPVKKPAVPPSAPTKKVVSPADGKSKKPSSGTQTRKRVIVKKSEAKQAVPSKKKLSPVVIIGVIAVIIAIAGYFYMGMA